MGGGLNGCDGREASKKKAKSKAPHTNPACGPPDSPQDLSSGPPVHPPGAHAKGANTGAISRAQPE